jgi:hypothetical protein
MQRRVTTTQWALNGSDAEPGDYSKQQRTGHNHVGGTDIGNRFLLQVGQRCLRRLANIHVRIVRQ